MSTKPWLRLATCALLTAPLAAACGETGETEFETGCETPLVTGQTFSLPQNEGDRSFQAHAGFDGSAIWLTHAGVLANEETMAVSALRVHCDGSIATPSQRLAEQSGLQTEPRVTSYRGQVLVAWQRDDQVSAQNLSTHYMVFDRDEGPAEALPQHLDTQYQGASAGNTWMPALSASKAGFAVAGLRGVSDYNAFQTFAQRLDHEGDFVGGAIDGELQDEMSQNFANASLSDDNSLVLGWSRTDADGKEHVVHVAVDADSDVPAHAPILVSDEQSSMASQGGNDAEGRFIVFNGPDGSIGIKPSTIFNEQAPVLVLKAPGGTALSPAVSVGPSGGAVAWLEPLSGYDSEIHVQGFSGDGFDMKLAGSAKSIATEAPAIGPYRVAIEHIQDSVYMVTWTEGPVASLQVKWQFVDIAE